jgi:hypothetical protein
VTVNIVLWLVGIALVLIAAWRGRAPFARMSELGRLADNAKRYESWRGGSSRTAAAGGNDRTGADEMRDVLRRQVYLWAGVGLVGVLLVIAGFVVR